MSPKPQLSCISCKANNWKTDDEASRITRVREGYWIVQCQKCGLRRLDPMPTQDDLRTYYVDDKLVSDYKEVNFSYISGQEDAEPYIAERLKKIANVVGKTGRILDIGAARGAFLSRAKEMGWETFGVEFSTEGVEYANSKGLHVQQKTVHEAAFDDQFFDVVHMSHVLEHVPDPIETLTEIHRILKPGGVVAIEIPNEFEDLFGSLRRVFLDRPRPAYAMRSPHVYFFTPKTFKQVLSDRGFTIFHHETPRRDDALSSRYFFGRWIRRLVFKSERSLLRGPLIETYAVRS